MLSNFDAPLSNLGTEVLLRVRKKMRAWVQVVSPSTSVFLAMEEAAHWFGRRGYEVVRFEFGDIDQGKLDDDLQNSPDEMVLRGGVETVRKALLRAGRPLPPNLDLPSSLQEWFGRRVWNTTLGEIRFAVESPEFEPCHIKPLNHHKLFTGTVVQAFRDLIPTASLPDDVPILAQGYLEFVSEWRVFVLRRQLLHVGRYKGNPLLFPDASVLRSALNSFDEQPIAFGMDWGITSCGKTRLVEVNDGYSLGNYGLRGADYTAIIEARWRELMGLSDRRI
ncbi:MAG: hypothetical protein C0483_12955 [Pirellula sp.]|nr:hypothetical protein [Pirellula sp.]